MFSSDMEMAKPQIPPMPIPNCGQRRPSVTHQGSDREKGGEIGDEASGERERRDEHEIRDERPFPSVSIAQQAKDQSAKGSEQQREGDAQCDRADGLVEIWGDSSSGERHGEETCREAHSRSET